MPFTTAPFFLHSFNHLSKSKIPRMLLLSLLGSSLFVYLHVGELTVIVPAKFRRSITDFCYQSGNPLFRTDVLKSRLGKVYATNLISSVSISLSRLLQTSKKTRTKQNTFNLTSLLLKFVCGQVVICCSIQSAMC